MSKPTKRAKKVKIRFIKVPTYRIEAHYSCPSCYTGFEELNGWNGMVEIVRFKCSQCGQELIIEK